MKNTLLIPLILLISFASFSQSKIKGKLVDDGQNADIEYASVALYLKKDSSLVAGAITGIDGTFVIQNVKSGDYYFVGKFLGYDSKIVNNIKVTKNAEIDLQTILLSPNQKLLDEIEITGEKVTTINNLKNTYLEQNVPTGA